MPKERGICTLCKSIIYEGDDGAVEIYGDLFCSQSCADEVKEKYQFPRIPGAPFYPTKFFIENGELFEGYTQGTRWNGWATPYFPKESADKLCRKNLDPLGYSPLMKYVPDHDSYISLDQDDNIEFFPEIITVDGKQIKVWPIGAYCWIWEELEKITEKKEFTYDQVQEG